MSSCIECICGEKLNKNLFSGNHWSVLVPEESIDKELVTESDINDIIVKSKIAKSCPSCGCLIMVDDKQSKVQFFKEQTLNA